MTIITIKRFDETEADIFLRTMGYFNDEEHAERALLEES